MPSRVYWFLSGIIEMILLFFLSAFKLNKPSDTLSREDISAMRRGNNPRNNGNDYNYRGSRGRSHFMQEAREFTWADEEEAVEHVCRKGKVR